MNMHRYIALLLILAVCLGILSGCTGTPPVTDGTSAAAETTPDAPDTDAPDTDAPDAPDVPDDPVRPYDGDEEIRIAYEKGFVPEALWAQMTETVTLAQLVSMVRTVVAGKNASVTDAFDRYMGEAQNIQAPADRTLAAVVFYYGTYLLEIPEQTWFSLLEDGSCWATSGVDLNDAIGERWDELTHLYADDEAYAGAFPHIYEGGYAWDGFWDGDATVAAYFSMLNRSTYDGRTYFDFDYEERTFHMDTPVTVEEAIRAVTRFYTVCHGEEMFMETIRAYNAASFHKSPISDYDIHGLADSIGIGIHFNHAGTDWTDTHGLGYIDLDSLWEVVTTEWEVRIGRDYAKAILQAYKEKGFDTVQLAVTFTPYFDPETDTLNREFLEYLEYWTNLILDCGMKCIIGSQRTYANGNTAYVDGVPTDTWMEPEYRAALDTEFAAMWSQIAEHFKDYDERVMFKPLIEPQQSIFPVVETGDYAYQAERINALNQICVDAVRAVGGNSEKRPLILGPLWGQFFMEAMVPPEDAYVIAYYHTYFSSFDPNDPAADQVVMDENSDILRWSEEDTVLMEWVNRTYEQIRVFKETYGIPLIIGEFATSAKLSEEDKQFMTTYVVNRANALDCPVVYWDGYFGGEGDTYFYHLGEDTWRSDALLDVMMRLAAQRRAAP